MLTRKWKLAKKLYLHAYKLFFIMPKTAIRVVVTVTCRVYCEQALENVLCIDIINL